MFVLNIWVSEEEVDVGMNKYVVLEIIFVFNKWDYEFWRVC